VRAVLPRFCLEQNLECSSPTIIRKSSLSSLITLSNLAKNNSKMTDFGHKI